MTCTTTVCQGQNQFVEMFGTDRFWRNPFGSLVIRPLCIRLHVGHAIDCVCQRCIMNIRELKRDVDNEVVGIDADLQRCMSDLSVCNYALV